jgi:hypothetical protein
MLLTIPELKVSVGIPRKHLAPNREIFVRLDWYRRFSFSFGGVEEPLQP